MTGRRCGLPLGQEHTEKCRPRRRGLHPPFKAQTIAACPGLEEVRLPTSQEERKSYGGKTKARDRPNLVKRVAWGEFCLSNTRLISEVAGL